MSSIRDAPRPQYGRGALKGLTVWKVAQNAPMISKAAAVVSPASPMSVRTSTQPLSPSAKVKRTAYIVAEGVVAFHEKTRRVDITRSAVVALKESREITKANFTVGIDHELLGSE